jgi:arsenical-resistance protein 2
MTSARPKWFDSLPAPISTPKQITPGDLHELLHGQTGAKVVVVDVRRADIEVKQHLCGTVYHTDVIQGDQAVMLPSAINLPAQTFHQTLPTLVPILNQ